MESVLSNIDFAREGRLHLPRGSTLTQQMFIKYLQYTEPLGLSAAL